MDQRFQPAFMQTIQTLSENEPFRTLNVRLQEAEVASLTPPRKLRDDARLFLLINTGYLIVKPWDISTKDDPFLKKHDKELSDDLREILQESDLLASQKGETEISANLMLEVVAHRRKGVRTRGRNIWGP